MEYAHCSREEIQEKYLKGSDETGKKVHRAEGLLRGENTEDNTLEEGTVRYDLLVSASMPGEEGKLGLLINLEAQNAFYPGYPLIRRAIYYCCRLISSQHGVEFSKGEYGKLKKVYSIWLCTNPPERIENTMTRYVIEEVCVRGQGRMKQKDYGLLCVVMVYLGKDILECKGNHGRFFGFLNLLFSPVLTGREKTEILKKEYDFALDEEEEREVEEMCNLSQGILQEGIRQGKEDMKKQIARNLFQKGMSVEDITEAVLAEKELVEKWVLGDKRLTEV